MDVVTVNNDQHGATDRMSRKSSCSDWQVESRTFLRTCHPGIRNFWKLAAASFVEPPTAKSISVLIQSAV
jgi:hypothetical protein